METERKEAGKRKEEEPTLTQLGDQELVDEELEDLLKRVPPSKRQRAKDRLTQLGVADS